MVITQRLTSLGITGALLFVVGSVLSAAIYPWVFSANWAPPAAIVAIVAALSGVPMMMVGRSFHFHPESDEKAAVARQLTDNWGDYK